MSDRLREALDLLSTRDGLLNRISRHNAAEFVEAVAVVCAVGRRWLALTETGPDYEAAWDAFMNYTARSGYDWPMVVREIADAALADYLTEEET